MDKKGINISKSWIEGHYSRYRHSTPTQVHWFDINANEPLTMWDVWEKGLSPEGIEPDVDKMVAMGIVPFVQTDMIALKKQYLEMMDDGELRERLNAITDLERFDYAFNKEMELDDGWSEFEIETRKENLRQWCRENNIRYYEDEDWYKDED